MNIILLGQNITGYNFNCSNTNKRTVGTGSN